MTDANKTRSGCRAAVLPVMVLVMTMAGCRGTRSDAPPVHINPNMDQQERFDPQEASDFFADGRAMRPRVAGTVPRGFLRDDVGFYYGRNTTGGFLPVAPVQMTRSLIERGRERYNIYCTPCHGGAGDGRGVVLTGGYGWFQAPTYHDDRLRSAEDGYLFDVVTNGVRTMHGYGTQIPVADRWAIVAYIRALQRSQNASQGDIPASVVADLQARGGAG